MSDNEDKEKKERGLLFLMIVFFTVGLTLYFVGKVLVKYVSEVKHAKIYKMAMTFRRGKTYV